MAMLQLRSILESQFFASYFLPISSGFLRISACLMPKSSACRFVLQFFY
jgi:hypothetical protein